MTANVRNVDPTRRSPNGITATLAVIVARARWINMVVFLQVRRLDNDNACLVISRAMAMVAVLSVGSFTTRGERAPLGVDQRRSNTSTYRVQTR